MANFTKRKKIVKIQAEIKTPEKTQRNKELVEKTTKLTNHWLESPRKKREVK